jgi:murein DD-endopeptidase MepM/ murein hydrolase activator NlpD
VVKENKYQSAAGNYIVIDGTHTGDDFMYAHLASPSPIHKHAKVLTGQRIGVTGATGDATGCHLHYEMWTPPGWYSGGHPFDPVSYLKAWDAYS